MDYRKIEIWKSIRSKYYSIGKICDRIRLKISKLGYKQSVYYTPISESKVLLLDHELYKIKRFFEQCKKHLGLPDVWIEWIEENTESNYRIFGGFKRDATLYGNADIESNKISIRADLPFDNILRTIAHECHHHWFYRKYGKSSYWNDEKMRESTANGFAGKMILEFRDTSGEDIMSLYNLSRI